MKSQIIVILLLLFSFSLNASDASEDDPALQTLLNFKDDREVSVSAEDSQQAERLFELKAKANSIGIQAGSFYASSKIRKLFESMTDQLDAMYDFGRLGLVQEYKGVFIINPVISEVNKAISLSPDLRSFVVRDQVYSIVKDPYMALTPPSWRDYFFFDVEPVEIPDDMLTPKSELEIKIWKTEMLKGYELGIQQANELARTRIARITRDIVGMKRYELLRMRNMVSNLKVKDVYYPVSGGGNKMNINETRVSIDVNPMLNANRWNWESVPRLSDVSELFPQGTELHNWVTN